MAQIKEYIIDTNTIIRYLKGDGKKQHIEKAQKTFKDLENGRIKIYLDSSVIAETCYILTEYYESSRDYYVDCMLSLLDMSNIRGEREVFERAIKIYSATELDITDCIVIAKYQLNKAKFTDILSFDDELVENKNIK